MSNESSGNGTDSLGEGNRAMAKPINPAYLSWHRYAQLASLAASLEHEIWLVEWDRCAKYNPPLSTFQRQADLYRVRAKVCARLSESNRASKDALRFLSQYERSMGRE